MKKGNREKILHAALKLFNEQGSANVTTNHIAEECGISPGNLYYHFHNKEEIIREIFNSMIQEADQSGALESNSSLEEKLSITLKFYWEYRFLHRELSILSANDDEFKKINGKIQKKRIFEIGTLLNGYVRSGTLRKLSSVEKKFLTDTIWMYSIYWQPYLENTGREVSKENVSQVIEYFKILLDMFRPMR